LLLRVVVAVEKDIMAVVVVLAAIYLHLLHYRQERLTQLPLAAAVLVAFHKQQLELAV
jgi:hypothetical protein